MNSGHWKRGHLLGFIPDSAFPGLGYFCHVDESSVIQLLLTRNAELLVDLVTQGKLPPEAKPPPNLSENPMDIFTSWLHSLSEPTRIRVLSHLTECSREKQFLKVSQNK